MRVKIKFSTPFLAIFFICLIACDKDETQSIKVNGSYFVIENSLPLNVTEELKIYVIENAHRDYKKVKPISYTWIIKDSIGEIVKDDFDQHSGNIRWVASEEGFYTVSLKINYGEGVSQENEITIQFVDDYRFIYSGNYYFMKVTDRWTESTGHNRDTTYYEGFIKPDSQDKNSIIIKCGEGILADRHNEHSSRELWYREGEEHPWFGKLGDHSYFNGYFINPDSVKITANHGGLGGGTYWVYYGSKNR